MAAARIMLDRLRALARTKQDFAFETTLSGRSYVPWLRGLGSEGYRRHLVFLLLPSADLAIARVVDRVRRGGHYVPDDVVRRRFTAGIRNLFSLYMNEVDSWAIYDNADLASPRLIASREWDGREAVADAAAWTALKELQS